MKRPPGEVLDLLERRRQARAARNFQQADALRTQIEAAGWGVVDHADGSELEDLGAAVHRFPTYASVPTELEEPDACAYSICFALYGWIEDARRLVAACATPDMEVVAVDAGDIGATPDDLDPGGLSGTRVVRVEEALGHAQALNVAMRNARGRVVFLVEPSLEFGAGALAALAAALEDPSVGVAGPFGLATEDMRSFEEASGSDVAALEYMLAIRRADAARLGEFDVHFRFYRNLDIDFSYQVRAAGLRVLRVDCGPVTRHEHRVWESTPEDERERLSRRNFNRFLDRWARGPGHEHHHHHGPN